MGRHFITLLCTTASAGLLHTHALAQEAPPPPQAPEAAGDIVVTGIRSSIETSQAIKRNSDQIVDVIVAEDIGKLPDVTASASLARITGIQVNRAAGEAAEVRVRGLPNLSTTYNGREIFTGQGRFVALQDFPAASVAALEVYKSSTADLIEGGIAGQINVRARKPFDFKGFRIFGSLDAVHFDQAQKIDWNGNLLVSNRWETGIGEIGVLVNANMANTDFLDSTREQGFAVQVGTPVAGAPGMYRPLTPAEFTAGRANDPGNIRYPDGQAVFFGEGNRWRPSVSAVLQWRPAPELELYVDGLFQGYRGRDSDRFLSSPVFGAGIQFSDVVLKPGTNQVESMTVTGGQRPDGYSGYRDAKTDTYQIAGGAIWDKGPLKISADVAYTDSTFTVEAGNIDFAFARSPVRDISFDVTHKDGGPVFAYRDFDLTDPDNFIFRGLFDQRSQAKGDDIQARVDVEYETGLDFIDAIQFGVRYNNRTASRRNGSQYLNVEAQRIPLADLPVDLILSPPGFRTGPFVQARRFVIAERDSVRDNIDQLRDIVDFDGPPAYNELESFDGDEKALAGYAQIKYDFDIGVPIDGSIGLRAVRTETTLSGISRLVEPNPSGPGNLPPVFVPIEQTNAYTDYLPNASARIKFLDNLQLRAAFTETRTRANFDQLNPSLNFGDIIPAACDPDSPIPPDGAPPGPGNPNCVFSASGGNPDLRPIMSSNYDLSLEYYFSRAGSATVAVFRRDVNGFISRISTETVDPELGRLNINRPFNGDNGRLQGIEVSLGTFFDFDFLPEWARGFGLRGNYTYLDAGAELPADQAESLPGQQPVVGVSEHAYNLVALYEKPQFSARLAYNYQSSFVDGYNRVRDFALPPAGQPNSAPFLPIIEDGRGVLDFSASVNPRENVTIAFNVSNILGEPVRRYRAYNVAGDVFPRQVKYLERIFSLGVRVRLQ